MPEPGRTAAWSRLPPRALRRKLAREAKTSERQPPRTFRRRPACGKQTKKTCVLILLQAGVPSKAATGSKVVHKGRKRRNGSRRAKTRQTNDGAWPRGRTEPIGM